MVCHHPANGRFKPFAFKFPRHVSHSIVNLQNTAEWFETDCKRLSAIMREVGLESLDLLKLDIEGAEYEVLGRLLGDNVRISVLCVV